MIGLGLALLSACGGGGGGPGAGNGGAAAGTGVQGGTAVQSTVAFTNADGLRLANNTLYMPAQATATRSAVVMLHGCAGAGSRLYDRWGETLAALGHVVVLVDSFTPRGSAGECDNGPGGVSEAFDRPKDALAAYDYVVNQLGVAPGRVALLGWSHGGSSALATLWFGQPRQPFAAGVAFYPGCGLWGQIANRYPSAPLFIHHGDADTTTLPAPCQALDAGEAAARGTDNIRLQMYAGAQHSFDNALEVCDPLGACTYGSAGGNVLTAADWAAKLTADAAALNQLRPFLAGP